jgi:hypothetical protein
MVRRSIQKILASQTVDVIIRVVVVLSLVVGAVAFYQTRELTKCVARYNNANNARSVALTAAQDEERMAERTADDAQAALFLSPILNKPGAQQTPAEQTELLRLFRAYQTALTNQTKERATADDARRDHPIPDPPKQVCD